MPPNFKAIGACQSKPASDITGTGYVSLWNDLNGKVFFTTNMNSTVGEVLQGSKIKYYPRPNEIFNFTDSFIYRVVVFSGNGSLSTNAGQTYSLSSTNVCNTESLCSTPLSFDPSSLSVKFSNITFQNTTNQVIYKVTPQLTLSPVTLASGSSSNISQYDYLVVKNTNSQTERRLKVSQTGIYDMADIPLCPIVPTASIKMTSTKKATAQTTNSIKITLTESRHSKSNLFDMQHSAVLSTVTPMNHITATTTIASTKDFAEFSTTMTPVMSSSSVDHVVLQLTIPNNKGNYSTESLQPVNSFSFSHSLETLFYDDETTSANNFIMTATQLPLGNPTKPGFQFIPQSGASIGEMSTSGVAFIGYFVILVLGVVLITCCKRRGKSIDNDDVYIPPIQPLEEFQEQGIDNVGALGTMRTDQYNQASSPSTANRTTRSATKRTF